MNISKGRLRAMTRFDTIHMDTSAFSSDEDGKKDMRITCFIVPGKP